MIDQAARQRALADDGMTAHERVRARFESAKAGTCPDCGGLAGPCTPERVHPKTPPDWECYGCTICTFTTSRGHAPGEHIAATRIEEPAR